MPDLDANLGAKSSAVTLTAAAKKTDGASRKRGRAICFTIMPFGGWFDDYYETLYRPAIEGAGLDPKRADDLYRPSTIVNDIWAYTQSAKVILADLTGKNPNVFYELGLAHALAKPAILITESVNDVPFDLRALRILEYDKNEPDWGEALKQDITRAIKEVVESPLESVLPAFLSVSASAKPKEVTQKDKAILELKRDLELLRNEMRREASSDIRDLPGPSETMDILRRYRDAKMPWPLAEQRLAVRGVPLPVLANFRKIVHYDSHRSKKPPKKGIKFRVSRVSSRL